MHWLLPGVATAASAAFAVAVLRQYAERRRPHQLAWGVALSMFALASLALTAGVTAGMRIQPPSMAPTMPCGATVPAVCRTA